MKKPKANAIPHQGWCVVYSGGNMGQVQYVYTEAKRIKNECGGNRIAHVEVREVKPRKKGGRK